MPARQLNQRRVLILFVAAVLLIVLALPFFLQASGNKSAVSEISTPTLPPSLSDLAPEKQTLEIRMQQTQAAAVLTYPPPAKNPSAGAPTFIAPTRPPVSSQRQAGAGTIIEGGPSPFPALTFAIQNAWYEEVNGRRITVLAGARRGDGASEFPHPWQSVVIVSVQSLDGKTSFPAEGGVLEAGIKADELRILDARGERLVLLAQNGQTLYFDVPTRQYVSSLN